MKESIHREVVISVDKVSLGGELFIPHNAGAIIVFSHGSGSSRFSVRNQRVAKYLQGKNFGTLLFDLLTGEEDLLYANRFNIELLTKRLACATQWLKNLPAAKDCHIGCFGASTGAASALQVAAQLPDVRAVVSRGGRPDLAPVTALHNVKAAVLLIVGSLDNDVLRLNKEAFNELRCEKELVVVDGATHLFEEPGKLDEVAKLATAWFEKYLNPVSSDKSFM